MDAMTSGTAVLVVQHPSCEHRRRSHGGRVHDRSVRAGNGEDDNREYRGRFNKFIAAGTIGKFRSVDVPDRRSHIAARAEAVSGSTYQGRVRNHQS